jgi:hypothetical protein
MLSRWNRWASLSGVAFVVLVVLGGPVAAGNTPGSKATGAHVIAFFEAHRSRERASAVLLTVAFIVFIFFAGSLRSYLRRRESVEGLSSIVLAAAAVLVAGQTAGSGLTFALSDAPARLSPGGAQVLNLLSNDMVLTSAAGFSVFGIASGVAILGGAPLPNWLGWMAIVIGVVVVTPAEFVAVIALAVWIIIVSILIAVRPHSGQQHDEPDAIRVAT